MGINQDKNKPKFTLVKIWEETQHINECYVWLRKVEVINRILKKQIVYSTVSNVQSPQKLFTESIGDEESQHSATTGLDDLHGHIRKLAICGQV